MEEKERNERLQETQQQFSPDHQSDLASQSVGPFCLRRPGRGHPTPQGCTDKLQELNIPFDINVYRGL